MGNTEKLSSVCATEKDKTGDVMAVTGERGLVDMLSLPRKVGGMAAWRLCGCRLSSPNLLPGLEIPLALDNHGSPR